MAGKPPRRIDRYEVEQLIAEGSIGRIYKAVDLPTGEVVALKVLPEDRIADRVTVGRFLREARAARDLDHPHIIKIHEVARWEGLYYLAMEWVDGETVRSLLDRQGALPIAQALDIACQIGSALAYAHGRQVLHRDVKPANIVLTRDGTAKLVDFGFAKRVGQEAEALTQTGMAMGTPHYISPEQVANAKHAGFSSDVYSFGATLYHMLTGRPPFVGRGAGEVLQRMMTERLVPPAALRPEVPAPLSRAVTRMLARRPQDRFASMHEAVAALEACRPAPGRERRGAAAP